MHLTFYILTSIKYLTKNFEFYFFLGGGAIFPFWPLKVGVSKMSTPELPMTPLFFYCRIGFYYKNGDDCKKKPEIRNTLKKRLEPMDKKGS